MAETSNMMYALVLVLTTLVLYFLAPRRKKRMIISASIPKPASIPNVALPELVMPEVSVNTPATTPTQKLLRDLQLQRQQWGSTIVNNPLPGNSTLVYLDRNDSEDEDEIVEPPAYSPDYLAIQFPESRKSKRPRIGNYYREPAAYTRFGEDYIQLQ